MKSPTTKSGRQTTHTITSATEADHLEVDLTQNDDTDDTNLAADTNPSHNDVNVVTSLAQMVPTQIDITQVGHQMGPTQVNHTQIGLSQTGTLQVNHTQIQSNLTNLGQLQIGLGQNLGSQMSPIQISNIPLNAKQVNPGQPSHTNAQTGGSNQNVSVEVGSPNFNLAQATDSTVQVSQPGTLILLNNPSFTFQNVNGQHIVRIHGGIIQASTQSTVSGTQTIPTSSQPNTSQPEVVLNIARLEGGPQCATQVQQHSNSPTQVEGLKILKSWSLQRKEWLPISDSQNDGKWILNREACLSRKDPVITKGSVDDGLSEMFDGYVDGTTSGDGFDWEDEECLSSKEVGSRSNTGAIRDTADTGFALAGSTTDSMSLSLECENDDDEMDNDNYSFDKGNNLSKQGAVDTRSGPRDVTYQYVYCRTTSPKDSRWLVVSDEDSGLSAFKDIDQSSNVENVELDLFRSRESSLESIDTNERRSQTPVSWEDVIACQKNDGNRKSSSKQRNWCEDFNSVKIVANQEIKRSGVPQEQGAMSVEQDSIADAIGEDFAGYSTDDTEEMEIEILGTDFAAKRPESDIESQNVKDVNEATCFDTRSVRVKRCYVPLCHFGSGCQTCNLGGKRMKTNAPWSKKIDTPSQNMGRKPKKSHLAIPYVNNLASKNSQANKNYTLTEPEADNLITQDSQQKLCSMCHLGQASPLWFTLEDKMVCQTCFRKKVVAPTPNWVNPKVVAKPALHVQSTGDNTTRDGYEVEVNGMKVLFKKSPSKNLQQGIQAGTKELVSENALKQNETDTCGSDQIESVKDKARRNLSGHGTINLGPSSRCGQGESVFEVDSGSSDCSVQFVSTGLYAENETSKKVTLTEQSAGICLDISSSKQNNGDYSQQIDLFCTTPTNDIESDLEEMSHSSIEPDVPVSSETGSDQCGKTDSYPTIGFVMPDEMSQNSTDSNSLSSRIDSICKFLETNDDTNLDNDSNDCVITAASTETQVDHTDCIVTPNNEVESRTDKDCFITSETGAVRESSNDCLIIAETRTESMSDSECMITSGTRSDNRANTDCVITFESGPRDKDSQIAVDSDEEFDFFKHWGSEASTGNKTNKTAGAREADNRGNSDCVITSESRPGKDSQIIVESDEDFDFFKHWGSEAATGDKVNKTCRVKPVVKKRAMEDEVIQDRFANQYTPNQSVVKRSGKKMGKNAIHEYFKKNPDPTPDKSVVRQIVQYPSTKGRGNCRICESRLKFKSWYVVDGFDYCSICFQSVEEAVLRERKTDEFHVVEDGISVTVEHQGSITSILRKYRSKTSVKDFATRFEELAQILHDKTKKVSAQSKANNAMVQSKAILVNQSDDPIVVDHWNQSDGTQRVVLEKPLEDDDVSCPNTRTAKKVIKQKVAARCILDYKGCGRCIKCTSLCEKCKCWRRGEMVLPFINDLHVSLCELDAVCTRCQVNHLDELSPGRPQRKQTRESGTCCYVMKK